MRIILLALLTMLAFPVHAADECESQLPKTLKAAVSTNYPGFRPPLVTDNLEEDINWSKKNTGKACLSVAHADFDGNGETDWIVGLTGKRAGEALVVVGLSKNGKWQLHELDKWSEGRTSLYVGVDKPGTYEGLVEEGGELEKSETARLVCPHVAAILGATESSAAVYCYSRNKWQHTLVSD